MYSFLNVAQWQTDTYFIVALFFLAYGGYLVIKGLSKPRKLINILFGAPLAIVGFLVSVIVLFG